MAQSNFEQLKHRIETTMMATTLCMVDQAVIHEYMAGLLTSDEMTSLLAIASRRKIELILGRRSSGRRFGR